jgi:hypothetical protein
MKCFECKYCKKTKKKNYMGFCFQFKVYVQDWLNGCLNGINK